MSNWKEDVKAYLEKNFGEPTIEGPMLEGFHNLMEKASKGENIHESSGTAKGYANGGIVSDDVSGPDFLNQLNQGSIKFDPQSGMPPQAPQPSISAPNPVTPPPSPVQSYLGAQKAQLNKFGPEEQLALQQNLMKQRNGILPTAGRALGTLGDSIMQGVARAGNPGFAAQIEGRQQGMAKEQMDALQNAGKLNTERTEANQKLDAQDPRSAVSKVAQQTWGVLLARNGFKPEQIANMPASAIAALTGQTVEALKAESEAKMAAATLGLKTQEAAQTAKHQSAEETTAAERERLEAAGKLAGRGMFKKITDAIFGDPGTEALEEKLKGGPVESGVPEINDQASYDALPAGASYTHNGIQHRKK